MRGFTLLEVMIALMICAGVLLTVISSVNHHLSVVSNDAEETTAALVGRAKLDDPEFKNEKDNKGTFAPAHPELKWERVITPDTPYPGINRITLTVKWNDDRNSLPLVKYAQSTQ